MAVRVHREADLAVPKDLHHHTWMDPLSKQQRGAGVSQVIEALVGQPARLRMRLKLLTALRGSIGVP